MSPVLLSWADAEAEAVHSLEAFGPVSSVIGYTDLDDAVRLAARGGGSLVATVCTNDPAVARSWSPASRPTTAACYMLNREDARISTGHGSPVPHLVHGGPGRAGGGEELGGIRSVMHHMQRTAIQGSPEHAHRRHRRLAHRRGPQLHARDRGQHPFRKSLATLHIGDAIRSELREVSWRKSRSSRTPPATPSTPTPTRKPPRPTRSSRASWRTATCCSLGRRPVRGARTGPGPGQLRPGEPAVHHPGGRRAIPSA